MYPTHESRVRPYFGSLPLQPEIIENDTEERKCVEHPDLPDQVSPATKYQERSGRATISELINGIFIKNNKRSDVPSQIRSDDNMILLELLDTMKGTIDSNFVFLTTLEPVKKLDKLLSVDQEAFRRSQRE